MDKKTKTQKDLRETTVNSVGSGGFAGLEPDTPPVGKSSVLRRKSPVGEFEVGDDVFNRVKFGKKKKARYAPIVGEDETGKAIREFGLRNPDKPIILQNAITGVRAYLRHPRGKR